MIDLFDLFNVRIMVCVIDFVVIG